MTAFYSIHFQDCDGYWSEQFPGMRTDDPRLIDTALIPFGKSALAIDDFFEDFAIVFECERGRNNVWIYSHDAGKPVDVSREQVRIESFTNDSHENHISAIMESLDEFLDDCRKMGFDGLR